MCYHACMKERNHIEEILTPSKEDLLALPVEEKKVSKDPLVPPSGTAVLQRYLWEISRYPLLTPEEEMRLAKLYKEKQETK